MKVLVAADSRSFHTERLVAELTVQGCEVLTVSLESGEMEHTLLKRRAPISTLAYALSAGQLRKVIDRFKPDIINAHYAAGYGYLASRLKRPHPPVMLHVWGSDILVVPHKSRFHRAKVLRGLHAAKVVVADSQYLADAVHKLRKNTPVEVIGWGVERGLFRHHRRDYALGSPLRIIVPRMHEEIYNNLFVVRSLRDQINDETVVITFPAFGSRYESFQRAANALVGDRIRYYERRPREEFIALMAKHDVYLSAALSDSSPVTLIEAMALGLIPVVGDIPGVNEWLTEGAGFRYSLDSEESLRRAVGELIASNDDFASMRKNNLEQVKARGIFEDNVRRQIELMQRIVAEGARP